jgi:hypothetical protein
MVGDQIFPFAGNTVIVSHCTGRVAPANVVPGRIGAQYIQRGLARDVTVAEHLRQGVPYDEIGIWLVLQHGEKRVRTW